MSRLMAKTIKAYNEPADDEDAPEVPLPHGRLHDLRHVHATLLLVAGVPVHVVADRLGARGPVDHAPGLRPCDPSHAAGIADVFAAAADHVDEDQDDEDDGPDPSAGVPC
ncbi:hypothetical protein [Kribbella caucasensis]|nr:hypothetical protein [Kribbella sp. VKM Ac-2527]